MDALRQAVRKALADEALQAALDANAERRRAARERAHATLPEPWEVMRGRAAEVRADILAHWDEVLTRFVARARANGFIVHQAADAAEARRIILDIVAAQGPAPRLVAKSKSMVTEEIALNAALEAAGHRVVETDLGEFIVQLRHERPAHIITPAVHLRRQEVAQTFHDLLGMPYTEDVAAMTATARRHLREVFLQADVGISGVNFGIADTGGICIVTNEGNGRMVTTLPRVHIAVMGAERLVRTPEDLALMLELLPRSATGQDLTVYTTLIHGPRRAGEDGPEERHLVIVDNGRQRLAQTPLADALRCIRCGACLNACPVFREIGGHAYVGRHGEPTPYPGPIGIVISPGLFGSEKFGNLPYLCTLCGACAEACPVEVPLPELILRARAPQPATRHSPPATRHSLFATRHSLFATRHAPPFRSFLALYARLATRPHLFRRAQRLLAAATPLLARLLPIPFLQGVGVSEETGIANEESGITNEELGIANEESGIANEEPPFAIRHSQFATRNSPFATRLTALDGEILPAPDMTTAGEAIVRFLQREEVTEVLAWAPEHLPAEVTAALQRAGIAFCHGEPAACRVGLTGAALGIAATGSIVVPSGAGRPQAASLLPEIHIAVLRRGDIVPDLTTALRRLDLAAAGMTAIITGPSRTADIEMTLTLGVHGPRRVVVVLVG